MTAREIISRIVQSCTDLDAEVPVLLLTRDEDGCVVQEQNHIYTLINGKILVERDCYAI